MEIKKDERLYFYTSHYHYRRQPLCYNNLDPWCVMVSIRPVFTNHHGTRMTHRKAQLKVIS